MKTISLVLAMAIVSFAYAQKDKRSFPRWQEEAIIMDVIHGDRCDSIKNLQAALIENQNDQLYKQGSELIKLKGIDTRRLNEAQSFKTTIANQDTLIRHWKRQDIKHRRQRNLVVAAVVVLEVLKFVFSGKLF